jgi:sugar lactone lactonase YvrE
MPQTRIAADQLFFGEGPRWYGGRLWFSDFYDRAVKSLDLQGVVRTEVELDDHPSGLGWMPDGRLLIVAMRARTVMRLGLGGLTVHADLTNIAEHRANDMVVDSRGGAYVGGFGFDLDAELKARGAPAVLAAHPTTVLARIEPDGSAQIAACDMHFPNGMVITPDGQTLIVAETLALRLTAFDIGSDGKLANRRVWAALGARAPDGICLDSDGNVWVANALAAECVLVAPGGRVLEVVETDQPCFACMLGGSTQRTLFMLTAPSAIAEVASKTRRGRILAAEVSAARAGWP